MSADSGKSSKGPVEIQSNDPYTREYLVKLKRKARRKGCWFRDLKQNERMLLDLTIRVVEKVRSFMLAKIVSRLVGILCEAMESRIFRRIRTEGRILAENLSEIAQAWGYRAAKSWATDCGFMQYLTVNSLGSFKT